MGCSMAQLALAWCIRNKNVSTVIIGASRVSQLLENIVSVEVSSRLDEALMARIDVILANVPTKAVDRM